MRYATSRVPAGRPWEASGWGYARAIRVGRQIEVSGTAALTPDGEVIAPDDAHAQTLEVLRQIAAALAELGATMADVIRTRVYVTDIDDFALVGKAHGSVFGDIQPCSTCVAVTALVDARLRVEIEASAIVSGEQDEPSA